MTLLTQILACPATLPLAMIALMVIFAFGALLWDTVAIAIYDYKRAKRCSRKARRSYR